MAAKLTLKKKAVTAPATTKPKTVDAVSKAAIVAMGIKVDRDIKTVDIKAVKAWQNNPRKNEKAVPRLAEILKARGQVTPVVVWRKNNVIYKGNTTVAALKLLGEKTVKVLYADFPSEAAAIAYGIADNKSGEWAGWDDELLNNLMSMESVVKAGSTGFTDTELLEMADKATGGPSKSERENPYYFWFAVPDESTFDLINAKFKCVKKEIPFQAVKGVL